MRRRVSAFSLVELLISIIFFSIAVPALCLMVNAGIETVYGNFAMDEAFNLARNGIEKSLNIGYDTLKNEVSREGAYDVARQVSLVAGLGGHSDGVKRVTVTVTRSSDGREMAVLVTDITGEGK